MENFLKKVTGTGALVAFLGLAACTENADLVQATETASQDPETALVAQLEPQPAVTKKLRSTGISASRFGISVKNAVQSHPTVLSQQHRIEGAQAAIDGAKSAYRPRLSVGIDAGAVSSTSGTSGPRIGPVVSLTKLIYDGSASKFTLNSRKQGLAIARLDRQIEATAIAMGAVQAQANLMRARALEHIARENLNDHEMLFDKIKSRVDAGAGSKADLLAGESRLASATAQLIESKRNRRQAESVFTEIFGSAPGTSMSYPPVLPRHLLRNGADAARRNAQLVQLDYAINQALFELASIQAGKNPSIVAEWSAGPTVGTSGISADVSANLGIRIALTTGGERNALAKQAQANIDDLNAQRDQMRRQIIRALDFSASDTAASGERRKAADLAEDAAIAALEAANEQFTIGKRTITQVLDAQRDLSQSAAAVVEAKTEQILVGYATLALTGDLLILFAVSLDAVAVDEG